MSAVFAFRRAYLCRVQQLQPWPEGDDMPQSVREQIMAAIAAAKDEGQRIMLLILLALADQMSEVREMTSEAASKMASLDKRFTLHDEAETQWRGDAFHGLTPDRHVVDHALVGDINDERRQASEDRRAIVRDAKTTIVIEAAKWITAAGLGAVGLKALGL